MTEVQETISVIMTVYNKSKYLEKSIQSVVDQTYDQIQFIIIDDNSDDSSKKIIKKMADLHNNIFAIYNDKNVGCYACRNIGLKYANGKYITFHDADDYSIKNRFELQIKHMIKNNLLLVGCNIARSEFDVIPNINDENLVKMLDIQKIKRYFGYATLIYNKNVFKKCGGFIEKRKGMDMEYGERILFVNYGIIFDGRDSWAFYNTQKNNIYEKMDMLLYVCPKMNNYNITTSIPDDDFLKNKEWRAKYKNIDNLK